MHLGIEAFEDLGSTPTANYHLPTTIYISTLLHGHFHDGEAPSLREGRAPARPLPRCRFRSSGSSTLPRRPAVAEDCDPPATRGDGALAIVSACQLLRHHVLATGNGRDKRDPPALCTTARAHPSCDRLRGSLRSGVMSLLLTTNYQLSTINYSLSTTFLHFYTAIFHDGEAPSLLHGHFPRRRGRRRYYTAISHDGEAPSLREGRAPARPRFLRCVVLCAAPAGQSLAIRPRAGVFGGRSRPPRRGSWRRAWRRWR